MLTVSLGPFAAREQVLRTSRLGAESGGIGARRRAGSSVAVKQDIDAIFGGIVPSDVSHAACPDAAGADAVFEQCLLHRICAPQGEVACPGSYTHLPLPPATVL